jgi:hypothetical protein
MLGSVVVVDVVGAAVVLVDMDVVVVLAARLVVEVVVVVVVVVGGGVVVVVAPVAYSMCSSGAPAGSPSYDSATRLPVPVMITTSALPLDHNGRSTIS